MATLADSLDELTLKPATQCKTALLLSELEPADKKALLSVLDDLDVTPNKISTWLGKNGFQVSADSIRRHRKRQQGGCLCPRDKE